ncbi:hypothetical protein LCL89_06805 [Halobacillus yeomjeoni]|uniref:hypothetical protein n=1 Tax=Halobacillus yeomjeoni TaxID=311194 RepID=UPI001CD705A8|nr:hypothetical protein [Halobacillus yeomjeoni]MCA0983766.1 hypothetical protein [Halobacillus yeomjeoni]
MIPRGFDDIQIDKADVTKTIDHMLEAIMTEEKALAEILESHACHIQSYVEESLHSSCLSGDSDLYMLSQSLKRIADQILLKEWLILKKVEVVIQLKQKSLETEGYHANKE